MGDTISRQALLEEYDRLHVGEPGRARKMIEDAPSVQPEKRTEERTETHACDLISRQAAIDELAKMMPSLLSPDGSHPADEEIFKAQEIFADCIKAIENLPSAQPERKTGKWISTDDGWDGEYFVCSVCGCPWTLIEGSPEDNGMNFCPNCGAYMRGEQNGQ